MKQQNVNTTKIILLNFRQKLLVQDFVIILMHLFSDAFVTADAGNNIKVAFKDYASFSAWKTEIVFIDEANHICIVMAMYNLVEYSDNYSDTSGSLWQLKRDEIPDNNADLIINNSQSCKYKAACRKNKSCCWLKKLYKKHKNSCSIKIFKHFLEITRNGITLLN